ncbi:hypothetical protein GGF38_001515, partial [Coemansia sp. RSA 25]
VREFVTLRIEAQGTRPPQTCMAVDCCIEKLDTSGELAGRMPLARALVAGYLRSLHRYSAALNVSAAGVHLFARAQPEYLFAKSKGNAGKRILDDLNLVNHPSACSESAAAGGRTAVVNCIVPGSTMRDSPWFFGKDDCAGSNEGVARVRSVDWRWGLPYPLNVRAHDCMLQFPDDPITRLLSEEHSTSQGHLSLEDYDKALIALFDQEMDFSNTESARLSSKRLMEYLDSNFDIPAIDVETAGPATTRGPIQDAKVCELPVVNDLSTMVRKKRKATS